MEFAHTIRGNIRRGETKLPAIEVKGKKIIPSIHCLKIPLDSSALISHAAKTENQMKCYRENGIYNLPYSYPGEVIALGNIPAKVWFYDQNNTDDLFSGEINKHPDKLIISTNAGNAPIHAWEVNYVKALGEYALAARDFKADPKRIAQREYACVVQRENGLPAIEAVTFSENGSPHNPLIDVAVGGRPLVISGNEVSLAEILEKSITDPRHVVLLPEVAVNEKDMVAIGVRSMQKKLMEGEADEIVKNIQENKSIFFDMAEQFRAYPNVDTEAYKEMLQLYGYEKHKDYKLEGSVLELKLKFSYYRHTFWARKGNTLFAGIITNDLPPLAKDATTADKTLYQKVLKPSGAKIEELQNFLINDLEVEDAVLMGNGKDCVIFVSAPPHDKNSILRIADNDVTLARKSITSGILSVII